jgi:lipopolysaccharide biosynthesis regulator YciM
MVLDPIYILILLILVLGIIGLILIGHAGRARRQYPPFTQALTYLLTGDRERALNKLRQVVKEDTDNIQAYILYGDILREMGQHSRAAKIHRELTVREYLKPETVSDIFRSLLQDYQAGGNYKQALICAEKLLAQNKNDLWTLHRKLSVLEELKDWRRADETWRKIQAISGEADNELLAFYKVMEGKQVISEEGREHEGRLRFRSALKIDRRCAWAYLELADSYLREGRIEDAISEWKELFKKNPQMAYLAFEKFEKTIFELGRFEELEPIYTQLLEADSRNSRAVVALARFLDRKGETEQAIRICREGLEAMPKSLWIKRNMFRFLASNNQVKEALEVGLEVIDMVTHEVNEFTCGNCGYVTRTPTWYCPECHKWRTFRY